MPNLPQSLARWLGISIVVVSAILAWRLTAPPSIRSDSPLPRAETEPIELQPDERATIELFRDLISSVTFITSLALRRDWMSFNVFEIPQGTGSGFVWDRDGHIVTNYHVVRGGQRAKVTLSDHSEWDAELVGVARDKDLAVLRIEAPRRNLKPLRIGTSTGLQVGQNVYAIGNPFGLDQTLTTGIISALDREIQSVTRRPITGVIQTDAAINPGNSGGPLLDSSGRLIGVNTAIYSPSGAYAGIGFAVPVDTVNRIVPQLIEHGEVIRPGLGISPFDDSVARSNRLEGVLVRSVENGGAAAEAGIRGTTRNRRGQVRLGDLITAIDDHPIRSLDDLFLSLDRYEVGDEVRVTIERGPRQIEFRLKLRALRN